MLVVRCPSLLLGLVDSSILVGLEFVGIELFRELGYARALNWKLLQRAQKNL